MFAFLPRMFAPFQSNSDELTMAADSAAAALVENKLIDVAGGDGNGSMVPGIINRSKYSDLRNKTDPAGPDYSYTNVEQMKKFLGIGYGSASNFYNLQIELSSPSSPDPLYNSFISPDGQPGNSNVGQSKRFVYVNKTGSYTMAILTVRVW
ncbi:MAG: hypothetical protein A4E28_01762 [Methanocella sp. PtaU1.Bin125]|nr:MAG: hypothetical protein A4E28_01762 [Methanocella sp. PtaU1.Bin125]